MNQRERFLATAGFQPVDRTFLLAPWAWQETIQRWCVESEAVTKAMCRETTDGVFDDAALHRMSEDLTRVFHTDCEQTAPVAMQGPYGPHLVPGLTRRVIKQTNEYQVVQDEEGNIVRLCKQDPSGSMPQWLRYPMKDRDDWQNIIKPRLDPKTPGRAPQGTALEEYARSVAARDYPLGIWCGSFYGWPRSFMGVERVSVLFYDDPGLIHEMCEHIADFAVEILTPILKQVQFDFAYIWEDMAGRAGPLCSPAIYREFCLGPLKRVTDLLHNHGVHNIIVDSDGNNDVLIPLWLEAGITGLRPFEIAADCYPVATRRKYGKNLIIQGGIDKRALAEGKEAIEREVLSKVPWLCMQGGYFPQVDHLVPPDVSLANYTYYSKLLCAVAEEPDRFMREATAKGFWKES